MVFTLGFFQPPQFPKKKQKKKKKGEKRRNQWVKSREKKGSSGPSFLIWILEKRMGVPGSNFAMLSSSKAANERCISFWSGRVMMGTWDLISSSENPVGIQLYRFPSRSLTIWASNKWDKSTFNSCGTSRSTGTNLSPDLFLKDELLTNTTKRTRQSGHLTCFPTPCHDVRPPHHQFHVP